MLLADRLRQAIFQMRRRNKKLAVAYVDLDGFKEINDSHGHDVGDQFLVALAARMKMVMRDGDSIARLGMNLSRY
nr:GGDEF domain-containing protein [Candidatus Reidiella endopervernicosa]